MRHSFTALSCLLAVAGVLAADSARAEEPAARKPTRAGASADASTPPQQVALPACLNKLGLSAEQQEQIQVIVDDYEADFASVWMQFSDQYLEAIRAEAMLLCAIEDNLTEAQRKQVREQRCRVAHHEKQRGDTNAKATPETAEPVSAVEEELAIVGISLTPEQEAAADRVHEKYISLLRTLNRDVQGLHTRLVSLEADKFVEIEKVLTEEQLKKLREIRQSEPSAGAFEAVQAR